MPKLKTKKGVVKRFKLNKKGKVKYYPCGKSHLLTAKKTKRRRHLKRAEYLENAQDIKYIKRMLPYG